MRRAVLALVLCLCCASGARAQVKSVQMFTDRSFGYFVGDLVTARIDVLAEDGFRLQTASLPRPGPLTTSLDLRDVQIADAPAGNARLWRITLTYQTFYVPLDVREIDIPRVSIRFASGAEQRTVEAPAWKVSMSPLREVLPPKRENATDYMRPDGVVARIDEAAATRSSAIFALSTIAALVLLARDRAWPPFHARPTRSFALAARRIARLARRGANAQARLDALLTLHRAIDRTAGRRVFAEDLSEFLSPRPEFDPLRPALEQFFSTSRIVFFGTANGRRQEIELPQILSLARELAACERRAR